MAGQWLDVRLPSEFKVFHYDGAVNVPLYLLRHKLNMLDHGTQYVVCCDTSRRSSAAAFILNQKEFQTVVLKSGLNQDEAGALRIAPDQPEVSPRLDENCSSPTL